MLCCTVFDYCCCTVARFILYKTKYMNFENLKMYLEIIIKTYNIQYCFFRFGFSILHASNLKWSNQFFKCNFAYCLIDALFVLFWLRSLRKEMPVCNFGCPCACWFVADASEGLFPVLLWPSFGELSVVGLSIWLKLEDSFLVVRTLVLWSTVGKDTELLGWISKHWTETS